MVEEGGKEEGLGQMQKLGLLHQVDDARIGARNKNICQYHAYQYSSVCIPSPQLCAHRLALFCLAINLHIHEVEEILSPDEEEMMLLSLWYHLLV